MSDACASCEGRCCYDIIVRVTGFDALRIARAHDLAFEEIVDVVADVREGAGAFRSSDGWKALFLTKSDVVPSACAFLMHLPAQTRRCGVYAERPRVCAVYPMTIRNGSVDIRDDVSCAASNWNLATLAYATWRRALAEYAMEWALYGRIVAAWNDAPEGRERDRSDRAFLAYARRACLALCDDPRLGPEVLGELVARWNEATPESLTLARRATAFEVVDELASARLLDA